MYKSKSMKNCIVVCLASVLSFQALAQKSKVQSAWRALSDYEETLKEGKPSLNYLNKAKEAIDMALTNDETKKQAKTHAYKLRISYAQFQYNLTEELKKLESTVQDKNQRTLMAYGNTDLKDFEVAADELNVIKDLDPKYLEEIQAATVKGTLGSLDDDELKFALAVQNMKAEASNIATGKYNAKRYDEAADYFYKTGFMNTIMNKSKDTVSFYNATISATKSKNNDKIIEYNKKMIDMQLANGATYVAMYNAYIAKGDTAGATEIMKRGRSAYPNDVALLTEETNLYVARGKTQEALANLKVATEKDPTNAFLFLFTGNLYDNLANPKDKNGKDLPKPTNFEELFKNAESNYSKTIELNPSNKEYLYNALFDLGAMYNNYGGMISMQRSEKITDQVKFQREQDAKANVYFKKAIPPLENALTIKPEDKQTMKALRVLYLKTGDTVKAQQMSDKLK